MKSPSPPIPLSIPPQGETSVCPLMVRLRRGMDYFSLSAWLSSRRCCRDLGLLLISSLMLGAAIIGPGVLCDLDEPSLLHWCGHNPSLHRAPLLMNENIWPFLHLRSKRLRACGTAPPRLFSRVRNEWPCSPLSLHLIESMWSPTLPLSLHPLFPHN